MDKEGKISNQKIIKVDKVKRGPNSAIIAIAIVGSIAVLSGGGIMVSHLIKKQSSSTSSISSVEDGNSSSSSSIGSSTVEAVASKLSSSVVSIVGTAQSRSSFFYGKDESTSTAGTGVIVTHDGYILTNKHVIEDATNIQVILSDGIVYKNVEVAAKDPLNDLAYLKIKGVSDLKPAELGDSKTLKIGQGVVAIGNALGQYQGTVTSGIISGVNRTVTASSGRSSSRTETLSDMIQTDAAINSGNSGGPLVNAKGQVIGINTAVASDANGIGFAIPISAAKGMLKSLTSSGKASRSVLGIKYISINPALAKENNLSEKYGAWIHDRRSGQSVQSGGAADKAGIKDGDIITAVNGVKIGSAGSVSSLISEYSPGETVKLTINRNGRTLDVNASLDKYSAFNLR